MRHSQNLLSFKIGFLLKKGMKNSIGGLYQPSYAKHEGDSDFTWVAVEDCITNLSELVAYYESLFLMIKNSGESLPKMWIRPCINYLDDVVFDFFWYDKLDSIEKMKDAVYHSSDGFVFYDTNQVWHFEISQIKGKLFFYESTQGFLFSPTFSDFNEKLLSVRQKIAFDVDDSGYINGTWAWEERSLFLKQMQEQLVIAKKVILYLTRHFGHDYWTK
ncbi:Uncharacterised protein [Capnocytophaga canimorsus]|nr:conserved hypothetical protein [Capnocytophaga canimorsus]VEJ20055.1 Uncharacterised protein [Capnocytophaga canimorsus]